MNRVLILAVLLAFTGVCASASVISLGTFAVNPQNTFLFESSNDVNIGALFINLASLCSGGSPAGCVAISGGSTTLQIIGIGSMCYDANTCIGENLGGVFDTNNTLLASTSLSGGNTNRLTGVVAVSGRPADPITTHNQNLNTFFGNVDTTVAGDFFLPTGNGITVVVPTGAQYLVIGVLDSYFTDDTLNGNNPLAIQINEITSQGPGSVPEPATLGMFAVGIVGLMAFRRFRSV
jgi:hypothetical protein